MMNTALIALPTTLALLSVSAARPQQADTDEQASRSEREFVLVEGEPMYTVLPKDGIPSIDAPRFVQAMEAMDFMAEDETVLGVVGVDGTAKAYSAWHLDSHEIVNDTLDGEPIAATW